VVAVGPTLALERSRTGGHSDAHPAATGAEPQPTASQTFPAVGVVLTTGGNIAHALSAADAIKAAADDGMRQDVQSTVAPVASLEMYTKSLGGAVPVSIPVWDVVYPNAPQQVYGPKDSDKPISAPPCDLHVIVNATTGAVIEGFQSGCSLQ